MEQLRIKHLLFATSMQRMLAFAINLPSVCLMAVQAWWHPIETFNSAGCQSDDASSVQRFVTAMPDRPHQAAVFP